MKGKKQTKKVATHALDVQTKSDIRKLPKAQLLLLMRPNEIEEYNQKNKENLE